MNRRIIFRWLAPLGFVAMIAAAALVVMLLWNWLMPVIFSLPSIGFWQAGGLFILARLLLGGFGGRGGFHPGWGPRNPIHAKWAKMTPEEREAFIRDRRHHMHRFWEGENPAKKNER